MAFLEGTLLGELFGVPTQRELMQQKLAEQIDQAQTGAASIPNPFSDQMGPEIKPFLNPQQAGVLKGLLPGAPEYVGQQLLQAATPQSPKLDANINRYLQAKEFDLVPSDMSYQQFTQIGKSPLVQNIVGDQVNPNKRVPLDTLKKLYDTQTGRMPSIATTEQDLISNPNRYQLKETPRPAESAGKQAMINTAKAEVPTIEPILFTPEGDINRGVIVEMATIDAAPASAMFLSEEAGRLRAAYELGIQAITRTETGAAMPPEEVRNTADRFKPKPWDHPETVKLKWRAYNLFLNNIEKYLDPHSTANTMAKAIADAKKQANKPPLSSFER